MKKIEEICNKCGNSNYLMIYDKKLYCRNCQKFVKKLDSEEFSRFKVSKQYPIYGEDTIE